MAGKSDALRNAALNAAARDAGANYFALFTADPGTTGANELSGGAYARVAATPPAASGGSVAFPSAVINVPGGTSVKYWARFTTASGGTPYDSGPLPGNGESFGSPGTLTLTLTMAQPA